VLTQFLWRPRSFGPRNEAMPYSGVNSAALLGRLGYNRAVLNLLLEIENATQTLGLVVFRG